MVGLLGRVLLGAVLVGLSAGGAWAQAGAGEEGAVAGVVLDRATGDPVAGAALEVVGQGKTGRTGVDGKYRLRVPPGTHEILVLAPLYEPLRLGGVVVQAGKVTTADAVLVPITQASVEVIEVLAQDQAEAAKLLQRKSATVVSDTISADSIKKSAGSHAADIIRATPSVTVKDEQFVFVRGLGPRYTSATLNGNRLPSPDPLKRGVPLDLFPAGVLEAVDIIKSYSPDLPGDFGGAIVDLQLRDFPVQLTYSLDLKIGGNTQTTFNDFLTYEGTEADFFGLGDAFRAPPASLPDFNLDEASDATRFQVGRDFKNIWNVDTATAPPDWGASLAVGNTLGRLGFQLAGLYSVEWRNRFDQIRNTYTNSGTPQDPEIVEADSFVADVSAFKTRLGGILTSAYELDDHKFTFRTLVSQNSFNQTTAESGKTFNLGPGFVQHQRQLQYVTDRLAYGQATGAHRFPWVELDWRTALAQTNRDEPDTRFTTYNGPVGEPPQWTDDSLGGVRINNQTEEGMTDSAADLTVPFQTWMPWGLASGLPAKFKFGPAYTYRKRDFAQRRFQYLVPGGSFNLTLPPETLLQPGNIGPGGVDFVEETQPRDTFDANEEVIAGYGMLEWPIIGETLQLVGGARVEYSLIQLNTRDQVAAAPLQVELRNVDPLPGLNLIYSPLDDMNVRLSYSQTVSRPEFRELAPTEFPAARGTLASFGNPDLVEAHLTSYDLRWEWFFSPLELVSFGLFYKQIEEPIEAVVFPQGSDQAVTWINAAEAKLLGFEFELRKGLGFAHDYLKNWNFITNVGYVDSTVDVPIVRVGGIQTQQTSTTRAMQGTAPFTVNAALEYARPGSLTARLEYFTAGDTVFLGGSFGLPDIIEEQRNDLNAVLILPLENLLGQPITARLSARNLLNGPQVFTQGDALYRRFTTGVSFSFSLQYSR